MLAWPTRPPKESSEASDECRLLPASDLDAPRPKQNYSRLTSGCFILLLLHLSATNADTPSGNPDILAFLVYTLIRMLKEEGEEEDQYGRLLDMT